MEFASGDGRDLYVRGYDLGYRLERGGGQANRRLGLVPVRLRFSRALALDVAVALVLAAAAQLQLWTVGGGQGQPGVVQSALLLAATLPLAWRRRRPATTLLAVSAALGIQAVLSPPADTIGSFLGLLLALFSAVTYGRQEGTLGSLGFAAIVIVYHLVRDPAANNPFVVVIELAVAAVVVFAAFAVRDRERRLRTTLELATRQTERRSAEMEEARGEERVRIAREMHDIIAHSVSVMVLQAGAARQALDRDREQARESLHLVEETGRETLSELRRLLGVLRQQPGADGLRPQPGIDRLGELVANARAAGVDVTARVDLMPSHLPASIDLAAYRVVQEGLTNVMKHADRARVDVEIAFVANSLKVTVADDGRGYSHATEPSGHGLAGLEERITLLGGAMSAGPRLDGGFELQATLPLDATP